MGVPGPFKIVLQAVERRHSPDTLGDPTAARVKVELARLFDLDEDTASNIIAAIPIVVVEGLDGRQAGVVRDRLRRLGDLGCRVVVTDDASETIPRVNWPELPAIARVADEEPRGRDPGTGHGHGARAAAGLACPACGAGLSIVLASGSRAVAPNGAPVGANGSAARTPDTAPSRAARDEGRTARPEPEPARSEPARPEPARPTPAATARPPAPSHTTDDWLDPPVGATAVGASAQKAASPAPDARRGTGRFDDASLLAFRGGQPAPPPPPAAFAPPPPPPREAPPAREVAVRTTTIPASAATARSQPAPLSRGPETQKELAELDVTFTDSGELPRPGSAQPAPAPSRSSAPAPSRTAAAPSRPSEPDIDIELLDSAEGPAPKKEPPRDSNKKKNTRFDDDDDDDDPLAHAFPDEPPKAAMAARASQSQLAQVNARDPFEDSRIVDPAPISGGLLGAGGGGGAPSPKGRDRDGRGGAPPPPPPPAKDDVDSLLDSASDILDAAPPHRRSPAHSASSEGGGRRAPDLDGDLDLLDGSGSRLLDSDEPVRGRSAPAKEAAKGKAPARKPADDDDDPFEKSVIEDEPPARGKSAPPARGGGSGKRPSIEDVLDMFGPEDEVPLDDGDGLDPPGLDLSPSGGARRTKSAPPADEGNELSDILEPLDPGEALQIIKTSKPPRPGQGRSMPSGVNGSANGHGRDDKSDPSLEALGADEALAILNPGSDPKKKKTRGVPFPASGEDLFEDSSRGSSSKAQKKKTDPFARARKQLASEDDGDPLEASPPARSKKSDSDRRPARGSGADLDAMADDPPAKPSKPGPRPGGGGAPSKSAGSGGDGDHGLVLSRIADPDKKEEAAAIIAEVKGCSVEEARRLTDRTIIPVLKGVSREEAELHLEKFKKVKIAGRVTTRQRS